MRSSEIRWRKLKLRLRDKHFANRKAPVLPSGSNRFSRSWLYGAVAPRIYLFIHLFIYSKYWVIFQHIHLWNWDICHIVGPTFVSYVLEVCRLRLEPQWHSSPPHCRSDNADADRTGISWFFLLFGAVAPRIYFLCTKQYFHTTKVENFLPKICWNCPLSRPNIQCRICLKTFVWIWEVSWIVDAGYWLSENKGN